MKKILIRLLVVLIILGIILGIAFFGYSFYQKSQNNEIKEKFYEYILGNNFQNIFDYTLEEKIISKLKEENYNAKTKVEFSNSFTNSYNFDFDKLTVELNSQSNNINKRISTKFNYSNNELFNIDILENSKYIAIKNTDVLNNCIGVNKERAKSIFQEVNPNISKLYNNIENYNIKNEINVNENNIFSKSNKEYLDNILKYLKSNEYVDEGIIVIEQSGEKVETNKYSLTISKQEFLNVYAVLTQMIVEDEDIIDMIISDDYINENEIADFESNINFNDIVIEEEEEIHSLRGESDSRNNQNSETQDYDTNSINEWEVLSKLSELSEKVNDKIDELQQYNQLINGIKYIFSVYTGIGLDIDEEDVKDNLNDIFEKTNQMFLEEIDDNENVKFVTYVSNGKNVKTSIYFGENLEVNIDYINQTDNKFQTIITLSEKTEDDKYNGYTITLTKNKTTAIDYNSIEIGIIKDTQIVSKIELKLNIEGTTNSNKFNNKINFLYSGKEGKFGTNISNELSFSSQEVETINADNTLLLENLDDSDLYYTLNKMNSVIDSVYNEKVSKLNLINTNTSDKIIQTNEQEDVVVESEEEKNEIIDLLIENIGDEMGRAQNEGRDYTIQDLKDLVIEGYDIQVSVSEEIAIIKIGDYSFKIDKDFNLSE